MNFKKIDIVKLVNDRHQELLNDFNNKCKEMGIKSNSEGYQVLREKLILKIMLYDKVVQEAYMKNIYHQSRGELVKGA